MKKVCIVILLFGQLLFSQKEYGRLSLELTTGLHVPFTSNKTIETSDYIGFKHINFGGRYMFTKKIGVKLGYRFDRFEQADNHNFGNSYHVLSLEGVYNLGRLRNEERYEERRFGLLGHLGITYTMAFPEFPVGTQMTGLFGSRPFGDHKYEQMGGLIFGLTPQYKLSKYFALVADISYLYNLEHQYAYSGHLIYADKTKVSGSYLNIGVGLHYYFGGRKEKIHADWY